MFVSGTENSECVGEVENDALAVLQHWIFLSLKKIKLTTAQIKLKGQF
jgi:hypothetical protein